MSWLGIKAAFAAYRTAFEVALLLLVCASLFGYGLHVGRQLAEGECAKARGDAAVTAHQAYVHQVEQGASAAAALRDELARNTEFSKGLQRRLVDVQVLAKRAVPPVVDGLPSPEVGPQMGDAGGPPDRLTAGALSLWNSALAGDNLPAGACGIDEPTAPACAAATEATLADAWANHAENADGCRADRLVLERLQRYLTSTTPRALP